jgi:hypothetical protein
MLNKGGESFFISRVKRMNTFVNQTRLRFSEEAFSKIKPEVREALKKYGDFKFNPTPQGYIEK